MGNIVGVVFAAVVIIVCGFLMAMIFDHDEPTFYDESDWEDTEFL